MSWWSVRFAVPAPMAEAAAWLLAEALDVPVEVQDGSTMARHGEADTCAVVVGLPQAPPADIDRQIAECLGRLGLPPTDIATRRTDDDTWKDGWKAFFRGASLSTRIAVHPPWEAPPPRPVTVAIDPGLAFGTGTHETTRGVMAALDDWLGERPPLELLDVGCGSAILSIAAAKLGHRAIGVEIDDVALQNARENVARNAVQARVTLHHGSADHPALDGRRFPLVLANILAVILVEIAPAIRARCAPGGALILSGMLVDQVERVRAAYPGFVVERRLEEGPWVILVLRAPEAPTEAAR